MTQWQDFRFGLRLLGGGIAVRMNAFTAVAITLFAAACIACYIPARRAAKVDPMAALRYE